MMHDVGGFRFPEINSRRQQPCQGHYDERCVREKGCSDKLSVGYSLEKCPFAKQCGRAVQDSQQARSDYENVKN